MKAPSHISRTRGFTLVEVIVAVAIWVVVMVAVSAFEVNVFKYQRSLSGSFTTLQSAQTVLKTVARDIRMVSIGSDGSYAISQAATSSITFFADTDNDGIKERIRYFFLYSTASSTLNRAVLVPTGSPLTYSPASEKSSVILYSVGNSSTTPMFEYYDNTYSGTQSPLTQPVTASNIRLVKINIVLTTTVGKTSTNQSYATQVNLRNLRDSL